MPFWICKHCDLLWKYKSTSSSMTFENTSNYRDITLFWISVAHDTATYLAWDIFRIQSLPKFIPTFNKTYLYR